MAVGGHRGCPGTCVSVVAIVTAYGRWCKNKLKNVDVDEQNVGKSTLFNALTCSQQAAASNFPFCTIDPNVGSVVVPDPHVDALSEVYQPSKRMYAEVKIVDIAGLVRGASNNAGLGNKFLEHIRQVDAIIHCVRCFPDVKITHVEGTVDPRRDLEIIDTELILSDLQTLENMIKRLQRKGDKAANKDDKFRLKVLEQCMAILSSDKPVRALQWDPQTLSEVPVSKILKDSGLLTAKPVMYVANVDETQMAQLFQGNQQVEQLTHVEQYATSQQGQHRIQLPSSANVAASPAMSSLISVGVVPVCAQLEADLSTASPEDRRELLASVGLKEPALATVASLSYRLLGLQSYYTAGQQEVRAWTVPIGASALQAARVIHSDIERGFIRAEVFSVADIVRHRSEATLRKEGLVRVEGKQYVVREDDVVHFLHSG